jgi:putative PIN family toxin of toxin-antitoxin system
VRAVFDTNIFISAFVIPGGNAEEAYLQAVCTTFELLTSIAILTETANKLRTKFEWSDERVAKLVGSISKTATVLKTEPHLHVLTDEADNRILECAVLAEADFIVTGDKHLLSLVHYQDTLIIRLAEFVEFVKKP